MISLVYYHIERDEIFLSNYIDACFFHLINGVYWDQIEILGVL